jgi:hypothetical protein
VENEQLLGPINNNRPLPFFPKIFLFFFIVEAEQMKIDT